VAVVSRVFADWRGAAKASSGGGGGGGLRDIFQSNDAKEAAAKKHTFWDQQPMPNKFGEEPPAGEAEPEMIDNKIAENVSPDPIALDEELGLEWCDAAWGAASLQSICEQVFELSKTGEPEETTSFSPDTGFLVWSMNPPNMRRDWLVGIRQRDSGLLVGFICGLPMSACIGGAVVEKVMEIKNLYVHPAFRGKRLTPILISEVSRRVRQHNYCVALYTSSVTITRPLCKARFYQRPLNVVKLSAVRFKEVSRGQTLPRLQRRYGETAALPAGWKRMEERHVGRAWQLLHSHLAQFKVHQMLSEAEFRYWFVNAHHSVHAYVEEDAQQQEIVAFCAWHVMEAHLTSNAGRPTIVSGAFSHYNAVAPGKELGDVIGAQVAQLRRDGVDVLMTLDIGGNEEALLDFEESRAEVTSEYLLYHLYNFRARPCDDVDQFKICFF
jgi:glycylpeptide N-tetradecanoyltransferase